MTRTGVRLGNEADLDYHFQETTDVLLAVEAAILPDQQVVEDLLTVDGSGPLRPIVSGDGVGRRTWLRAQGAFRASYRATVEVMREQVDLATLEATPRPELPPETVPYLWPSRYCEADRFETFVNREFDGLDGGERIAAMADWIHGRLEYCPGSSDSTTTAADTFVARQGVCRDYAHLLAAFARASGVPARLVSAYGWEVDPPDFHADAELWLRGAWRHADPSRLPALEGLVRICAGRDATDIAFMTSFEAAEMNAQSITVSRLA